MRRILSLVNAIMYIIGGICISNTRFQLQIAWAGSYILLNFLYWIVADSGAQLHWDASCYSVTQECFLDSAMNKKGFPSENKTFTQALWKVIAIVKSTDWEYRSNACPQTPVWQGWLRMAEIRSSNTLLMKKEGVHDIQTWQVPDWDSQRYLAELFPREMSSVKEHRVEGNTQIVNEKSIEGPTTEIQVAYQNYLEGAIADGMATLDSTIEREWRTSDIEISAVDIITIHTPLLNHVRNSSLWTYFAKALRRFVRPRIPKGCRRIEWTCVSSDLF